MSRIDTALSTLVKTAAIRLPAMRRPSFSLARDIGGQPSNSLSNFGVRAAMGLPLGFGAALANYVPENGVLRTALQSYDNAQPVSPEAIRWLLARRAARQDKAWHTPTPNAKLRQLEIAERPISVPR
jgi:hypothetical protein